MNFPSKFSTGLEFSFFVLGGGRFKSQVTSSTFILDSIIEKENKAEKTKTNKTKNR